MPDQKPRPSLPVPVPGASVPAPKAPTPPAWPIRPAPSAVPFVDQGFGARRRARAFARNLDLGTAAAEAARRYFAAAEAAEAAHQSAEAQHEKRRSLPIIAATERAGLLTAYTQAAQGLDAAQHEREERAADHRHRQLTDALQWQKVALALQGDIAQAHITLDAIRGAGIAQEARRTREQEIANEEHRLEMLKRDLIALDLIADLRSKLDTLRTQNTGADTTPEPFRRHYEASREVLRNRSEAQRRIDEIYLRAALERRPLNDDEIADVDAIADADGAAQDEVRRSAASDLK